MAVRPGVKKNEHDTGRKEYAGRLKNVNCERTKGEYRRAYGEYMRQQRTHKSNEKLLSRSRDNNINYKMPRKTRHHTETTGGHIKTSGGHKEAIGGIKTYQEAAARHIGPSVA